MGIQWDVGDPLPDDEGLDLIEDLLVEEPETTAPSGPDTGTGAPG
jgi:hypothetical protein